MDNKKASLHFFYPFRVYLTWFFYYLWPSRKNHFPIKKIPQSKNELYEGEKIKLLFFGDLMATKSGHAPEFHPNLQAKIKNCDFVIGNCEFPLTTGEKGKHLFLFQMSSQILKDLINKMGIQANQLILSIANNHMGDQGLNGFFETQDVLKEMGIKAIGLFDRKSYPDSSLTILEKNQSRIGLIAWSEWLNWRVFDEEQGILRKTEFLKIKLRELKIKNKLDCLIVIPHWGHEFQHYPLKQNIELAHQLFNEGVDVIVGHHPHVLQPGIEDNGRYCFFSLGNLNGPDFPIVSWPIKLGALLEVELNIKKQTSVSEKPETNDLVGPKNNKKRLQINYSAIPFFQSITSDNVQLVSLENSAIRFKNKLIRRFHEVFPN